jgi:predicted  nucleic acid-binding Zn-ribbon protein
MIYDAHMARGMMSQTRTRIEEASQDLRILNAPLTVVMKAYGLSYPNTQKAIKAASERARKSKTLAQVEERIAIDSLITTIRTAEDKYPNITVQAVEAVNHAALGKKHQLSRERVRQIGEAVKQLAQKLGKTEREIASLATKGRLPKTERDELASTISAS